MDKLQVVKARSVSIATRAGVNLEDRKMQFPLKTDELHDKIPLLPFIAIYIPQSKPQGDVIDCILALEPWNSLLKHVSTSFLVKD
jgi:hypothetical protein